MCLKVKAPTLPDMVRATTLPTSLPLALHNSTIPLFLKLYLDFFRKNGPHHLYNGHFWGHEQPHLDHALCLRAHTSLLTSSSDNGLCYLPRQFSFPDIARVSACYCALPLDFLFWTRSPRGALSMFARRAHSTRLLCPGSSMTSKVVYMMQTKAIRQLEEQRNPESFSHTVSRDWLCLLATRIVPGSLLLRDRSLDE